MPSTAALAPVREVGVVTRAMIVVTCAAGVLSTWTAWHRHQVAVDYVAGEPGIGVADYVSADNTAANMELLWLLAYCVTVVTFLTWAWRVRSNAQRLCPLPHRLRRRWVIGGWLVPFFPLIVLEDVWRTSRPSLPDAAHARELPRVPLVHYWWWSVVACVLVNLWLTDAHAGEPTLDALRDIAGSTSVLAVLQIVAAALLTGIIRQITNWQSAPRTVSGPA